MDEEKKVSEILPPTEILAQMSEEFSEGAQAALKLRRALDGTNPTPKTIEECWENLKEEFGDVLNSIYALLDEKGKPIGKFCHIYWRHPTTTDCILGDCNVTYEPDGIERTQGYSFSNTPDEIRKWNKRSLSWDMNKAKWR